MENGGISLTSKWKTNFLDWRKLVLHYPYPAPDIFRISGQQQIRVNVTKYSHSNIRKYSHWRKLPAPPLVCTWHISDKWSASNQSKCHQIFSTPHMQITSYKGNVFQHIYFTGESWEFSFSSICLRYIWIYYLFEVHRIYFKLYLLLWGRAHTHMRFFCCHICHRAVRA